jgi:hypothetical protein
MYEKIKGYYPFFLFMKIHRLFFVFFFFFLFIFNSNAWWYGWAWYDKTINDGATWCPTDGDTTWWSPLFTPWNGFSNYNYDSQVTSESWNNMYCQFWDAALPTWTISSFNGWTNVTTQNINFTYSDAGGSSLDKYTVQYRVSSDNPNFTVWWWWTDLSWCVNRTSWNTCSMWGLSNNNAYQYRIVIYDRAWNVWYIYGTETIKIDTTAPSISDVSNSNPLNMLATDGYTYGISVSENWGSPITSIVTNTENSNNQNQYTNRSSTNSSLVFSWDIQNIDQIAGYKISNTLPHGGSREFSFTVNQICDQAGNCWNGSNVTNHYVYANTTQISTKTAIQNEIDDIWNVADWWEKRLFIRLRDAFGNAITSASWIGRTVDFNFNVTNGVFLNQYSNSWPSWVKISFPNNTTSYSSLTTWTAVTQSVDNQISTNGDYEFRFKVYTPTYNAYNKAPLGSEFTINNVTFDINRATSVATWDWPQSQDVAWTTGVQSWFDALYKTVISWAIKDDGLIEGTVQQSNVLLTKTSSPVDGTSRNIYLEFWTWARASVPNLNLYYSQSWNPSIQSVEWNQASLTYTPYVSIFSTPSQNYPLKTKLIQASWFSVWNLQSTYLSTHIWYTLDWYSVAYNSDIINKNNYFEDITLANNTSQWWVKITWITASKNKNEIIDNQFTQDISILWNIYKTTVKKDIISNVYSLIKSITADNGTRNIRDLTSFSSSSNSWKKLLKDTVLYFGDLDGSQVVLWDGDEQIDGVKTIIVVWGDLYIQNNMYYQNKSEDILGVIVLKDENGKGGNLYIDPSVTNIVWTYIIDKSIISYNWGELDGNTLQDILKNQLHIFGSVFSENTIWWSRANPVKCPYYVSSCNQEMAQKYDLNFLRRFTLNTLWIPIGTNAKVIGWWRYDSTSWTFVSWASYFARNITSLTDSYLKYPVVIEYNALVSKVYPPLFSK